MPRMSLRSRVIRLAASQAPGSPLRRLLLAAMFQSAFDIGDPVWVAVGDARVKANIRVVTFTAGKVRYAVQVRMKDGSVTTFHNIDSVLVSPRPEGAKLKYPFDNYS